jgi:hypothetical protein
VIALHFPSVRRLALLAAISFAAFAVVVPAQTLQLPPYPANLDLSSVEGLYVSAAYRVEVRRAGVGEFQRSVVFETRNDWIYYNFFDADPARRSQVLRSATQVGNPKADIRTASFVNFSFADTAVDVRITLLQPGAAANSVTIRPLRHGYAAAISADRRTISFTLRRPQKVSVEINDRLDPLFIFADAPDLPDTSATHYFGPGLHRIPGSGTLTVRSNERVYVAAGAIVEGRFALQANSANITIRGRGILSRGEWPHPADISFNSLTTLSTIGTSGSHHLSIEGLTIVQSTGWQLAIEDFSTRGDATHNNAYVNLKMVSFAGNTDGIWVTGRNNRVSDCFIFNNDDAFVCKGGGDTTITDCVVWGGPWGHLLLLHTILGAFPTIENLTLDNIDVIGREGSPEIIWGSGRAGREIRNVTLRNIRFEERRRPGNTNNTPYNALRLVNFNAAECTSSITNLLFENISLDQRLPDEGQFLGSAATPYSNITFRNLRMGGTLILSAAEARITANEHVSNLRFLPPTPPSLGLVPSDRTVAPGEAFLLQAEARADATAYQWMRDGADLPGETRASLLRSGAAAVDAGTYAVRVSSPAGATTSPPARVDVTTDAARLVNLSCRTSLAPGALAIPGFTLAGSGRKTVLVRAVGPGLEAFGVANTLGDPRLQLYRDAALLAANEDWSAAEVLDAFSRTGAFALRPGSRDAALLATLDAPGAYSVHVGAASGGGVVLIEVYDADGASPAAARLGNVSIRGHAAAGDAALILGFVSSGRGTRSFLVRGAGPALTAFGVAGAVADARLDVYDNATRVLVSNDDWGWFPQAPQLEQVRTLVGAFPFAPVSRDAAVVVALAPGAYSAIVAGTNGTAGAALAEVYLAP